MTLGSDLKVLLNFGSVFLVAAILAACSGSSDLGRDGNPVLTISAASNLIPAFEEIGERFELETGIRIEFNFGGSGQLTEQIIQGAPVDVFASADVAYIDVLIDEDLIVSSSVTDFARGRIVLWTANGTSLELQELRDLSQPSVETLALANPAYAPFGKAAREALESVGLWERVEDQIVFGDNVSQTLHMAEIGSADAAIVALSLVLDSDGDWTLIPEAQHEPIRQVIAVVQGTQNEEAARQFVVYLMSATGQEILQNFGYEGVAQ
jgi:molybdate transport system substrate-binding protein